MEETKHIDKYYTTIENMLSRFYKHYREDGYKGDFERGDFEKWRKSAKRKLSDLLGMERIFEDSVSSLDSVIAESVETDQFLREKVYLTVDESVVVPMYVFNPKGQSKGIWIALSGHQGAGKDSVAGLRDTLALTERTDNYNYDYGLILANNGYTVLVPDTRGYGERREEYMQGDEVDKYLRSSCKELSSVANAIGLSLTGLYVYDLIKITDYIYKRYALHDEGIGVIGFSGGALQGLYFAALDERVKRSFLSSYFYGFGDSLILLNNNCTCNYPHGVFRSFDMADILMLSAPNNTVIQCSDEDHLNGRRGVVNVLEQYDLAKRAWEIYGKELILDSGYKTDHMFHPDRLLPLVAKLEER